MPVWMVLVAGEGELAVVADTSHEAARIVAEEVVRACRLRVRPASPEAADRLLTAKPNQRLRVMRELCDLFPVRLGETRREERRLKEHIALQRRIEEYARELVAKSPPLPPAVVRELIDILWGRLGTTSPSKEAIVGKARLPTDDPRLQRAEWKNMPRSPGWPVREQDR